MKRTIAIACSLALLALSARAGSLLELYERGYVKLTLDLEIGGEDADEDHVLYSPRAVCVDSRDNILVMDYKLFCIKVFDPEGNYLSSIGRKGEGPGEFFWPATMAMDSRDRIATYDINKQEIQVFGADHEHSLSKRYQDLIWALEPGPAGTWYAHVHERNLYDPHAPVMVKIVRFSKDFESSSVVDSMSVLMNVTIEYENGMTMTSLPFYASLEWAATPGGGLVIGRTDEYRLRVLSPELKEAGIIGRDVDPPPVTDKDREEYFEDRGESPVPNYVAKLRKAVKFPETKPCYDSIIVDEEGNVLVRWIERDEEDVPLYDVFDASQQFVARVKIDGMSPSALFHGGFVYIHTADPDELPTVRRYRLESSPTRAP